MVTSLPILYCNTESHKLIIKPDLDLAGVGLLQGLLFYFPFYQINNLSLINVVEVGSRVDVYEG